MHGGSAPQVREAARRRLLALVDPALATLARSLKLDGPAASVALAAAKDVLDRAGMKGAEVLQLTGVDGAPIQNEVIVRLVKADGR